jgi:hypothetical protein
MLPQLPRFSGMMLYSEHFGGPGSVLVGFDAVNHTPSKSSVSGRTPTTAATQKPTQTSDNLAPGSTNRPWSLRLRDSVLLPQVSAVPTCGECSFPDSIDKDYQQTCT